MQSERMVTVTLMGVPLTFATESPDLIRCVHAAYGSWFNQHEIDAEARFRIHLRLWGDSPGLVQFEVQESRLTIRGGGVEAVADAAQGLAECAVAARLLDDPQSLIEDALDPLVLFLVTRAGRVPLHAAAVMVDETAIVLAGPSGSGKSSLALAAMEAGLQVLSEDSVYVQLEPGFRLWGWPGAVHVFERDAPGHSGAMRLKSGRRKAAIPIPAQLGARLWADRAQLFLLERGDHVAIEPVAPAEAVDALAKRLEPGFDHFAATAPAVLAALAAGGAWRLTLSDDPRQAIAILRERFSEASS